MVFSSTIFVFLFLPLVLGAYHLVPRSARNGVLLVASLVFYAWGETVFVGIMLTSIALNYLFGLMIDRRVGNADGGRAARRILALAVAANLAILVVFKYANFLVHEANTVRQSLGAAPWDWSNIHLPLGISFFTFQAISYIVDVYRGQAHVQRNPLRLALYISLFPQLIAGPIVRYREIEEQLTGRQRSWAEASHGVQRFVIGLSKKVLLANPLSVPVEEIFSLSDGAITPGIAWAGVVCYMLQLYFDFSGYSDMAIGLGHLFGFKFPENFSYPFAARTVRDLWTRWHISLTSWFRDYLYIPMGGNRSGSLRVGLNLVTVFVLCGFWHGPHWNYIIFGLYHGLFLVLERNDGVRRVQSALPAILQHTYTLAVWLFGLAIFRTDSMTQCWTFVGAMLGLGGPSDSWRTAGEFLTPDVLKYLVVGAIASLPILPAWLRFLGRRQRGAGATPVAGWLSYLGTTAVALLLVLSLLGLAASTHNPFIYFRF